MPPTFPTPTLSFSALSHAHLRDTCTILKPQFWHLFPGWGAALTSHAPHVLANCQRYLQQLSHTHHHVPFFFQAHATASWQLSRRKSSPVAYLTPERLAVFWADSDQHPSVSLTLDDEQRLFQQRRERLAEACVRSNHVDDAWTGVSLARWMALFPPKVVSSSRTTTTCYRPLFSAALWQMADTKEDVWDFWMAYEKQLRLSSTTSNTADNNSHTNDDDDASWSILNPHHPLVPALRNDASARQEWMDRAFVGASTDDGGMDELQESVDRILYYYDEHRLQRSNNHHHKSSFMIHNPHSNNDHSSILELARAWEILCAHTAVRPMAQPPVPNGRYAFEGGVAKPDCVEVAVREVMNLLLWSHDKNNNTRTTATTGHYDLDRLSFLRGNDPNSQNDSNHVVNDAVMSFYQQQNQQLRQSSHDKNEPLTLNSTIDAKDDAKVWFEMLQNLPDCQYLSKSPLGNPYELTPTLHNISSVVHLLLGGKSRTPWTSLKDLERAWNNDDFSSSSSSSNSSRRPKLHVSTRKVSHRPALADEMVHHEFATLFLDNASNGIELKLDKAHAIATVSHFKRQSVDNHPFHDSERLSKLCDLTIHSNPSDPMQTPLRMMSLIMMRDLGLQKSTARPRFTSSRQEDGGNDSFSQQSQLLLDVLAAPYGTQRRNLMELSVTSDLNMELQAYKKATRESLAVLENAVIHTCQALENLTPNEDSTQHEELVALLTWLLSESPLVSLDPSLPERHLNSTGFALPDQTSGESSLTDEIWQSLIFNPHVERALLQLPPEILIRTLNPPRKEKHKSQDPPLFWASRRPQMLQSLAEWKLGNVSTGTLMTRTLQEAPRKLPTLVALMVKSHLPAR